VAVLPRSVNWSFTAIPSTRGWLWICLRARAHRLPETFKVTKWTRLLIILGSDERGVFRGGGFERHGEFMMNEIRDEATKRWRSWQIGPN
jgi:hypothetical protein